MLRARRTAGLGKLHCGIKATRKGRSGLEAAKPYVVSPLAHRRAPRERFIGELEPVPQPQIGRPGNYQPFAHADVEAGAHNQFWVQAIRLSGGSSTQLELPRGAHRFFGANFDDYDFDHVDHIAEPILVSGGRSWRDRPLTWPGDNAMSLASNAEKPLDASDFSVESIKLVAGAGFAQERTKWMLRRSA